MIRFTLAAIACHEVIWYSAGGASLGLIAGVVV